MEDLYSIISRGKIEQEEKWKDVCSQIYTTKAFNFHNDWDVRIIPPFGGAFARFHVLKKDDSDKKVSVYLDMMDRLGCEGEPYWEAYNFTDDDDTPSRFTMYDTDGLMAYITKCLDGE